MAASIFFRRPRKPIFGTTVVCHVSTNKSQLVTLPVLRHTGRKCIMVGDSEQVSKQTLFVKQGTTHAFAACSANDNRFALA